MLPRQPIQVEALTRKRVSKQRDSGDSSSTTSDNFSLHDESSDFCFGSSDEEETLETSFQDILRTPEVKKQNTNKRRKALNYQAVEVTRALFQDKQKKKKNKSVKAVKGHTEKRERDKNGTTAPKCLSVKVV